MIAYLKPYPEHDESELALLRPIARNEELSADILAIEKGAGGLLAGIFGGEKQ